MNIQNRIPFALALLALIISVMHQPANVSAQLANTSINTGTSSPSANCGPSNTNAPGSVYIEGDNGHIWTCSGIVWIDNTAAASGVPSGLVGMVVSGSCPSGYSEVTALDANMPEGTLSAHGDIGGTGGANTITPTVASLTAAAQTFTGSSATTSAVSAGTPAGTNGTVTGPAQTISYPVNVPTIAAGVFTQPTISWPAGVPTSGAIAIGTFVNVATATTGNSAATNIAAGTGSLTAAKATAPNLTVPAEGHSGSLTPPTISWPAGVPTNASGAFSEGAISWPVNPPTNATSTIPAETFTGSVLATHTHTLTATGTNGTSSVTGTLSSFDNRSAFVKVIFCSKT